MRINIFKEKRLIYLFFQIFHFLFAFGFLIFGLIEFVSNPPYFDGYGDAKDSQKQLPKDLFQVRFTLNTVIKQERNLYENIYT